MSEEQNSEDTYDVGYGKPPKHTQWQKGQSGNPFGKKIKEQSLFDELKKLCDKEIVVQQNGVSMPMTQGKAMLTAAFNKAMNGDLGSIKFIYQNLDIAEAGLSEAKVPALTEDLLHVLETHADWVDVVESARAELAETSGNQEEEGDEDAAF
ncbi:hypothetical protein C1J05_11890 [Sulfitobacter sp. JL08]|uniref:DUF5681 domain-containing protein n=1 Tax=Sulfitobacter sp. JL08 TaxID=2070369 RepID=UPI000E0A9348|nr:DUF5681 domain-containing protein [Sulfitobacter sp. JL08]AXI55097.1 hypothetical protein C1J05_11890 [Sulfitobacter sp. JL08]